MTVKFINVTFRFLFIWVYLEIRQNIYVGRKHATATAYFNDVMSYNDVDPSEIFFFLLCEYEIISDGLLSFYFELLLK